MGFLYNRTRSLWRITAGHAMSQWTLVGGALLTDGWPQIPTVWSVSTASVVALLGEVSLEEHFLFMSVGHGWTKQTPNKHSYTNPDPPVRPQRRALQRISRCSRKQKLQVLERWNQRLGAV